jgi:adenylate cyclase
MFWNNNSLLKKALALYAGEHVLQNVLREGDVALSRKGIDTELTMLFVDVASSTQLERRLSSQEFGNLTSNYFECVAQAVASHGGTLDSFFGDMVFGWWGAAKNGSHPKSACACAKQIVADVESLSAANEAVGLPMFKVKIGIHTGMVSLGNYGSTRRLKFTAMGDVVNLTARLCSLANGGYQTPIVISEVTKERLPPEFPTSPLDTVRIKGKDGSMALYTI